MTQTNKRTWFITGATSGIGRELVELALENGENVAAAARSTASLTSLTEEWASQLLPIDVDVRDASAVAAAVGRVVVRFGRIDVVANNAGYGLFGAVEEASDQQARAIFDTNVFGVLNVLRATLPVLRAQRSGHVLQGSSLYGQSAHSGVGLLAATKYAVEGITDALAGEVEPLGIKVTLIQPGPTATSFLANLDFAGAQLEDYDQTVRAVQKAIGELPAEAFASARRVAEGIREVVASDAPPVRLALGSSGAAQMRAALTARLDELDLWAKVTDAAGA